MKYVNKDLIGLIAKGVVTISLVGGINGAIYTYEKKEQVTEVPYKIEETFKDEEGNVYKNFEVGEHKIIISRNDRIFNTKNIDGYMIESVKKDNYFIYDNLKITYVNTEPVLVKATNVDNNIVYFNEFGSLQKNIGSNKIR